MTTKIGQHKKDRLNTVRVYNNRPGRLRMVIHGGPTKKAPKLATIKEVPWKSSIFRVSKGASDFDIVLPSSKPGGEEVVEIRSQHVSLFKRVFQFSVPVGPGGRIETFEWRHSRGSDSAYTKKLPKCWGWGWKLLRLESSGGDGSSDGKECVAAYAGAKWSGTKRFKYELFNSGASGQLGERFELFAYVTFLAIWDMVSTYLSLIILHFSSRLWT